MSIRSNVVDAPKCLNKEYVHLIIRQTYYVCLYLSVSVSLYVCLIVAVYMSLSVFLRLYVSVFVCIFICLCISLSISMFLCLYVSVHMSVYLCYMPLYICLCLSVSVYVTLPVCLSASFSVYLPLSICLCLSVCLGNLKQGVNASLPKGWWTPLLFIWDNDSQKFSPVGRISTMRAQRMGLMILHTWWVDTDGWWGAHWIGVELKHRCKKTLTPKNKNVKNAFYEKIRNFEKRWIKNVVDKLTKLIKPNEKFPSKITVLICMTTCEGYGSSWENFLFLPC